MDKTLEELKKEYDEIRKKIDDLVTRRLNITREIRDLSGLAQEYSEDSYSYHFYTLDEISFARIRGRLAYEQMIKLDLELQVDIPAKIKELKNALKEIVKATEDEYEVLYRLMPSSDKEPEDLEDDFSFLNLIYPDEESKDPEDGFSLWNLL